MTATKPAVLALLLLSSSAALADGPSTAPEHAWSIGAGLGFGSYALGSSVLGGTPGASGSLGLGGLGTLYGSPAAVLDVERLLSPQTAVLIGLSLQASSHSIPADSVPAGSAAYTSSTAVGASALIGLRRELTDLASVAQVSIYGALSLGFATESQDYTSRSGGGTATVTSASASLFQFALLGGLVVERQLLERLSLRLSAHLFTSAYSIGKSQASAAAPSYTNSGFDLRLAVDPSLELRLAF